MDNYGKIKSEKIAEENKQARQIVLEISNFGISDRQRCLIMYFLALELEDFEKVREVTSFLKEVYPDINMTHIFEGSES